MCFETTKTARAKIAKTDIECWKGLETTRGVLISPLKQFEYYANQKMRNVKIGKEYDDMNWIINEGYHSFKTLEILNYAIGNYWYLCISKPHKFIIPAGTRYYENETEYVSETIMLVE